MEQNLTQPHADATAPPAEEPGYLARVRLPIFEGPLDLLLHLVKVNELEITDISIFTITQQYLDSLQAMAELNLEIAGDFLVMAATLINIKSRSLLPRHEDEAQAAQQEEEIDEILSVHDLVRRLVEYRKVKEISHSLRALEESHSGVYYRAEVIQVIPGAEEDRLPRQDIRILFDAFVRALKSARVPDPQHTVYRERFTVEEKIAELRTRLAREEQINLLRLFQTAVDKEEIVCLLLATLEMARLREITVAQAGPFEDILLAPWNANVVYVG